MCPELNHENCATAAMEMSDLKMLGNLGRNKTMKDLKVEKAPNLWLPMTLQFIIV